MVLLSQKLSAHAAAAQQQQPPAASSQQETDAQSTLRASQPPPPVASARAAGTGVPPSTAASRWSLAGLIGPIVANLQLVITRLHVRYEDDGGSWPGRRLALGVNLTRVAAQTVDERGEPAWVAAALGQALRKVGGGCVCVAGLGARAGRVRAGDDP
jgi:hypothetical protein